VIGSRSAPRHRVGSVWLSVRLDAHHANPTTAERWRAAIPRALPGRAIRSDMNQDALLASAPRTFRPAGLDHHDSPDWLLLAGSAPTGRPARACRSAARRARTDQARRQPPRRALRRRAPARGDRQSAHEPAAPGPVRRTDIGPGHATRGSSRRPHPPGDQVGGTAAIIVTHNRRITHYADGGGDPRRSHHRRGRLTSCMNSEARPKATEHQRCISVAAALADSSQRTGAPACTGRLQSCIAFCR
jgi:hypothetical protein